METPEENELNDELKVCADCGKEFWFTVGEQIFFSNKGLQPRKRCKECCKRRKATIVPPPDWLKDIDTARQVTFPTEGVDDA